jgi:hypothetical protein
MARLPFCIGNLHRIRGTGATVHSNGRTRENQQSMVLDNPVRTVDYRILNKHADWHRAGGQADAQRAPADRRL